MDGKRRLYQEDVDRIQEFHRCIGREAREQVLERVGRLPDAVAACAHHPAVFAFSVVNEIPPDVVRWAGAEKVTEFIDELVAVAKDVDPECLCTFANFPPTAYNSITAVYTASANFDTATSGTGTMTVNKTTPTVAVTSSPNRTQ